MKKVLPLLALFLALMSACWADDTTEQFRKAAEQGDAKAQYKLGNAYDWKKDPVEAMKWFRKSAEQGYAEAQSAVGVQYFCGEGVAKDVVEAYAWFTVADAGGAEFAHNARDAAEKKMTKEQIAQAEKRAKAIMASIKK